MRTERAFCAIGMNDEVISIGSVSGSGRGGGNQVINITPEKLTIALFIPPQM